jgi:hypothetical protein
MHRRSMTPLILPLGLWLGCAATGANSPEGWNRVQTKNFTMYTATMVDPLVKTLRPEEAGVRAVRGA